MGLGDALSNIAKINPATIFAGSTPNLPGPLGSAQYAIDELSNKSSLATQLERLYFQAKSKFLPSWLKLHIPIDNVKDPFERGYDRNGEYEGNEKQGYYGRTIPGTYSTFDVVGSIMSQAKNFLRPNRYQVFMFAPQIVSKELDLYHISLSCSGAAIPGKALGTTDVRNGTPNVYKRPNDIIYQPIRLTFQVSESGIERELFERWISYIYNEDTETFEYPNTYYANVDIHQYDVKYELVAKYTLIDAYPTNISDILLSYDSNDTIQTFEVEMTYKHWTKE